MSASRIFPGLLGTLALLTVLSRVAFAQSATVRGDQIKSGIIERIEQQIVELTRVRAGESDVLAALAASDPLNYQSALQRLVSRGNDYAESALELIKSEKGALAEILNATNYRAGLAACLSKTIERRAKKKVEILSKARDDIRASLPEKAPSHLATMLRALNDKGRVEEGRERLGLSPDPQDTAHQGAISVCLHGTPDVPAIVAISEQPLSVKWNAPCLASEHPNAGGTVPLTWPTVASILYDDGVHGPTAFCTGTLIAPNVVLTAAHCFCQTAAKQPGGYFFRTARDCSQGRFVRSGLAQAALDPRHHSVYFQHAGVFGVKQVIVHPDFLWLGALPNADIALLMLDRPVPDIAPTPINNVARLRPGTAATAVGYGYFRPILPNGAPADTIEIKQETGLKLQAPVITNACSPYVADRGMICWTHRRRARGVSLGSTCVGDSGGPLFAEHRGRTYLVGVTSAGSVNCEPGSRAFDTEVFVFREWIMSHVARNAPSQQPRKPAGVDQNKCVLCTYCDQFLNQPFGDGRNDIKVDSPRYKRLRVSVNCTPSINHTSVRLSLRLRPDPSPGLALNTGSGQNRSASVCGNQAGNQTVNSCEVAVQYGQEWSVNIDGIFDRQCQIVATTFDN